MSKELKEIVVPMIDEDSIKGIAKIYREIVGKCYDLAVRQSTLSKAELSQLATLHSLAKEIVSIWKVTPDEILMAAREG